MRTSITVVENISAETPADISVLDSTGIESVPGTDLDDRLRQIPGFTLYRRTSSVVANPTTQGVSLRGLGSSGASRTLVLWDGIPGNDPFGGWVYWTQFIPEEMDRVEVSRGAATSVFGDRAMSGAIGLFTHPFGQPEVLAQYEAGNEGSQDATLGFADLWSGMALSGTARAFETDGYYIVPQPIRGPVDTQAAVRFVTGDLRADRYTSFGNFFFRFDALAEERHNGTELTHNSTGLGTLSLRYARDFTHDSISLLVYHTREEFHSSFSSVNAKRTIETLTYTETVPADAAGGAAIWRHQGSAWHLVTGSDASRAGGTSTDHLVPTGLRVGGGVQWQEGVFGQADRELGPARFFAGVRENFTGSTRFLSPNAGVAAGKKRLRGRAAVYRAFRAPTLNELYREFRVGNTDTLANPNLRPETVFGAETGVDWIGENTAFRVTAYRNSLDNLITNVTLSSTANSILRERENTAAATSRGVEADLRGHYRHWTGQLEYLYADSRYSTGPRIAEVPRHQGTAQLAWQRGGTLASAAMRSYSYQFDDDLNQYLLPGYTVLEFSAIQRLAASLSAVVSVENALNRTFYTAFTPTPNIGMPRLWHIGLRWRGRVW